MYLMTTIDCIQGRGPEAALWTLPCWNQRGNSGERKLHDVVVGRHLPDQDPGCIFKFRCRFVKNICYLIRCGLAAGKFYPSICTPVTSNGLLHIAWDIKSAIES